MIRFEYTLHEHGWATLGAELGDVRFDFRVSNMSDALEDFVSGVVALLAGAESARFALINEPGEHAWALLRKDGRLSMTVARLRGMYYTKGYLAGTRPDKPPPEQRGTVVLSFECPLREFAGAVAGMVVDVTARYTESDFKRTRNPPLPPALAARLRELTRG